MLLMLVFVYSQFCAFILKVHRDKWQEMVGWGGRGDSRWCPLPGLSCRMFVLHGTCSAGSSLVSRPGVWWTVLLSSRVGGRSAGTVAVVTALHWTWALTLCLVFRLWWGAGWQAGSRKGAHPAGELTGSRMEAGFAPLPHSSTPGAEGFPPAVPPERSCLILSSTAVLMRLVRLGALWFRPPACSQSRFQPRCSVFSELCCCCCCCCEGNVCLNTTCAHLSLSTVHTERRIFLPEMSLTTLFALTQRAVMSRTAAFTSGSTSRVTMAIGVITSANRSRSQP